MRNDPGLIFENYVGESAKRNLYRFGKKQY